MMLQKEKRISLPSHKQLFYESEMKRPLLIKTKSYQQKKVFETVNQKNIEGKQNYSRRKTVYENIEKPVDKMGKTLSKVRTPFKLRLSQQNFIKTTSIFKNITSRQKDQNQAIITKDLKQEIIFLLFQNKLLQKGHSNNVFLNLESIGMIMDKFMNIFDPKQLTQKSSQLAFMNGCLEKLRELKLPQINSEKNKKFTINEQLSIQFNTEQFNVSVGNVKDELKQLIFTRQSLLQLNRQIQDKNQKLTITLLQKRRVLQQEIQKITTIRRQLEEYCQQKRNIQGKLQQLRSDQQKMQVEVLRIINYVDNQNRNMHVRNASRDYKEIQSNIYEYAAYLQANQMATSLQFQSIPLKNQIFIIERLENEIKDLNKNLINSEQLSVEDKGRRMRDFVLELNNQYRRKDEEQQRNIQFKTKCIRKFVQMMQLWVDNWTLKQQFLVDLRKQFAYNAFMLDEQFQNLFAQNLCPECSNNTQSMRSKIIQNHKRMRENYCLGNSFY